MSDEEPGGVRNRAPDRDFRQSLPRRRNSSEPCGT